MAAARDDEERRSEWQSLSRRFLRNRLAVIGAVVFLAVVLVAALANLLAPAGPYVTDEANWRGYPLAPGVAGHVLGTDENGRDLLARLMFGARTSLGIALLAVLVEVVVGAPLGAIAGYFGGHIDFWCMRFADAVWSIPPFPLLLVLIAIVAAHAKTFPPPHFLPNLAILIGAFAWPSIARVTRATFSSLRHREFVEAARAVGNRAGRVFFRHLVPNAVAPIVAAAVVEIGSVILAESTLSFFGFGVQPPTPSWGNMLANAESNMAIAPWVATLPGICIVVTVMSIFALGDGLRDALVPDTR